MPAPIETWAEAAVTVPAARRSRAKSALRVVFISHLVGFISARCWSSSKCNFRARSPTYKARAVPGGSPRGDAWRDPEGGRLGGGKGTPNTAPFAAGEWRPSGRALITPALFSHLPPPDREKRGACPRDVVVETRFVPAPGKNQNKSGQSLPLLPDGRGGGREKRAGVMRANGPRTPI